jgi:hypothetical protein
VKRSSFYRIGAQGRGFDEYDDLLFRRGVKENRKIQKAWRRFCHCVLVIDSACGLRLQFYGLPTYQELDDQAL